MKRSVCRGTISSKSSYWRLHWEIISLSLNLNLKYSFTTSSTWDTVDVVSAGRPQSWNVKFILDILTFLFKCRMKKKKPSWSHFISSLALILCHSFTFNQCRKSCWLYLWVTGSHELKASENKWRLSFKNIEKKWKGTKINIKNRCVSFNQYRETFGVEFESMVSHDLGAKILMKNMKTLIKNIKKYIWKTVKSNKSVEAKIQNFKIIKG